MLSVFEVACIDVRTHVQLAVINHHVVFLIILMVSSRGRAALRTPPSDVRRLWACREGLRC